MTLLFIDGFDHYLDKYDIALKWSGNIDVGNSFTAPHANYGRWGAGYKGMRIYYTDSIESILAAHQSTIYFGAALYWYNGFTRNNSYPFLFFRDGGTTQVSFHMEASSSKLTVSRGTGTLLATADIRTMLNTWNFFEVKVVFSTTVGQVKMRLNGDVIMNETGLNTDAGATGLMDRFRISANSAWYCYWDDIYVDNAQFHGDKRAQSFYPDADGTHVDLAASAGARYQCVDEQGKNDDTDYVYGGGMGSKATFGITTGALTNVRAAQLITAPRKTGALVTAIKPIVRSGGADYQGTEKVLTTTYNYTEDIFETDPDDSNPWTQTKLEAAEFGAEVTQFTTTTSTTTTTTTV